MGNTDGALLYPDGSNHRCVLSAFFYFFIRPYSYRWKPCYGLKAYGVCMPAGFHIHGIDVSHYQGNIDWQRLTQTRQSQFPIHFIFMKASEGGDYGDRVFRQILIQPRLMDLFAELTISIIRKQTRFVRLISLSIP